MSIFKPFAIASNLTVAFFKIATWANILAAIGVIGTVAQAVSNQPLLNIAFGQERGAALSLVAIAISHAATTITAHGEPVGSLAVNVSASNASTVPITVSASPPA
jgi:hypothetical protein